MEYDVDTIVGDVRTVIDMNRQDGLIAGADETDTLDLDSLIRSKVEDGAKAVFMMARNELLDVSVVKGTVERGEEAAVPDDFLKFVFAKADGWKRAVYTAERAEDASYDIEQSGYAGLMATDARPKAFVVTGTAGKLTLQMCPRHVGGEYTFGYVTEPKVTAKDRINIPERVYRSVVYMTGAMVSATLNDYSQSGWLATVAKTLIGIPSENAAKEAGQ